MNSEATQLADRFEDAHRQVITAISECPEEVLSAHCPAERCTLAGRSKAEALERLHRNGADAVALLGTLTDADLDRTTPFALFGGPTVSVRQMIEYVLIADPLEPIESIRAATGTPALT